MPAAFGWNKIFFAVSRQPSKQAEAAMIATSPGMVLTSLTCIGALGLAAQILRTRWGANLHFDEHGV